MAKKLFKRAKKGITYTCEVKPFFTECPVEGTKRIGCSEYPIMNGRSIEKIYFTLIKDMGKAKEQSKPYSVDYWVNVFTSQYGVNRTHGKMICLGILHLEKKGFCREKMWRIIHTLDKTNPKQKLLVNRLLEHFKGR